MPYQVAVLSYRLAFLTSGTVDYDYTNTGGTLSHQPLTSEQWSAGLPLDFNAASATLNALLISSTLDGHYRFDITRRAPTVQLITLAAVSASGVALTSPLLATHLPLLVPSFSSGVFTLRTVQLDYVASNVSLTVTFSLAGSVWLNQISTFDNVMPPAGTAGLLASGQATEWMPLSTLS